ncbi:MAG: hypothetical protein AAFQ65_12190 [Myxococcota bacterium]
MDHELRCNPNAIKVARISLLAHIDGLESIEALVDDGALLGP